MRQYKGGGNTCDGGAQSHSALEKRAFCRRPLAVSAIFVQILTRCMPLLSQVGLERALPA
jgi:hypothetical protein